MLTRVDCGRKGRMRWEQTRRLPSGGTAAFIRPLVFRLTMFHHTMLRHMDTCLDPHGSSPKAMNSAPSIDVNPRAETLVAAFARAGYPRVSPAILQPAEPFFDLSG